jgi:preprotein translocase subunit SecG
MNFLIGILTAIHVIVAVFLIVLVLMQKSHEQGVGAAFGGGMTDTVFGGGTTTALVRMTIWCACILLATTLILAVLHSHRGTTSRSLMQRVIQTSPSVPMTTPAETQPSALPVSPETQPVQPSTAPAQQQLPIKEEATEPATPQPQPTK